MNEKLPPPYRPQRVDLRESGTISPEEFETVFIEECETNIGERFLLVTSTPDDQGIVGYVKLGIISRAPDTRDIGFPVVASALKGANADDFEGPFVSGFDPRYISGKVIIGGEEMVIGEEGEKEKTTIILFGDKVQDYLEENEGLQRIGKELNYMVDGLVEGIS